MGQGRLFKRGGVWWIQFSVGGRQYRETAHTTRKEQADALLRERLQSVWEGRFFPGKRRQRQLTVGALRDLWIEEHPHKASLRHDKARLARAVAFFGEHRLVATLTSDDVVTWRKDLEGAGLSVATVNRHLAALRGALRYADKRGYANRNPMAGVELEAEKNARNRLCTPEEYAKLHDAGDIYVRAVLSIGYRVGLRLNEIVQLGRDRIDLARREYRLGAADTKEGDVKTVPVPAEVVEDLKRLPARLNGRFFPSGSGYYSKEFAKLCKGLGIVGLHFHDLRHTAETNMLDAGVDIFVVQAITGHKTLGMTKRYRHVTSRTLQEAMAKVEAHATGRDRS